MHETNRREFLQATGFGLAGSAIAFAEAAEAPQITKFVRFQHNGKTAYGLVVGGQVQPLAAPPFEALDVKAEKIPLSAVKLLVPTTPSKVVALAGNYRSHLSTKPPPKHPEGFFKLPSCLVPPEGEIVLPKGSNDVHFEGELVIVIGKKAKNVPAAEAGKYVLGVTCGNDVSARDWQKADVQWWRAKGSDTFGPCGPFIVAGLNYDNLLLRLRVNGEVKQQERTSEMIHNVAAIVSWISQHVTLDPGDLIYTGTPGTTSALKPGDVVEVDIEGIGVLRNKVVAA